jgi:thiol-disulfide isomerase/thioredoxin
MGSGAENKLFRAIFFISLCTFFSFVNSCAQTKNPAQKSSAETKVRAANQPRVTQIDDAKIKQLLKPGGKPLLVNFWATWCGPCREEFPDLVKIDREYRGKIDFITVSLDFIEELNTGVPKFLSGMKAEMPTYLLTSADENTIISSIAKDWNGALPFTILYSEKGEITYLRQGKVNHETLKSEIEKTLGEKMGRSEKPFVNFNFASRFLYVLTVRKTHREHSRS